MSKWPYLAVAGGCLLVLGSGTTAQSPSQEQSGDMLAATCGEYLAAASAADPGKNPSKKRQKEAEDAQDALADSMLWVHGYQTGLAGATAAPQPLTRDWMVDHIRKLLTYCRDNSPDGNMLLVDAARRL